jgi:hypothetical protein
MPRANPHAHWPLMLALCMVMHPRLGVESPLSSLPKELLEGIIKDALTDALQRTRLVAQGNTRTRGSNYPKHKKQRAQTALLDLIVTKLREGHDFTALTLKVLASELENIARTLAGDDEEEINLNAANHPHSFRNVVTVLFQNEFRKGAAKERPGARTKRSSAAPARGFARVLADFAPSDDPASEMAQLCRSCVDAGLGEDKLEAVRLMRHFQSAPDADDDEPGAQDHAGMQSMVPASLGDEDFEDLAGSPLFHNLFGGTECADVDDFMLLP